MPLNMRRVSYVVCCSLLLSTMVVRAETPQNITPGEIARLPEYCPISQTFLQGGMRENPLPQQRPWVVKMGMAFWAVHHYCWALVNVGRATAPGLLPQQRLHLYNSAIADIHYVLQNAQADFVLLPELYLRMGDYSIEANRLGEAVEWYEKSRRTKADYWPAYVRLSKLNVKLGRKPAAIEVLTQGLEKMPNERRLLAALKELGVAPPSPAPAPSAAAAAAPPDAASTPPAAVAPAASSGK